MTFTAVVELNRNVDSHNGSLKKLDRPLGRRSIQAVASGQRMPAGTASAVLALVSPAAQPAPAPRQAPQNASAKAIPKTEALPGALIEAQRKRIFYFILKHVNNREDAEDLTQEALLQAYLSFASFQGQSSFTTWMTGIALNLVRNHVNRAPQRRYCFVDDEVLQTVASDAGDPMTETHLDQLMERLEQELPKLPAALREALVLVAVRGLSYEEAAQVQQTTVENVKNRLFRARQALRKTVLEL
ncbi:MAG: RNA polymerase sigma factor [Candidatus Competibacter sp.]